MQLQHLKNQLSHCMVWSFLTCSLVLISTNIHSQVITCIEEINVSLDEHCESHIAPIDVLSEFDMGETYDVVLTDHAGNTLPDDTIRIAQLGTQVMFQVTNSGNNRCWGSLTVEDKLAPIINCIDTIRIDCFESKDTIPTHMDNCTESRIEILSERLVPLHCDDDYIKRIDRVYRATDTYGNSSTCRQTVLLNRIDLSLIIFPDTFSIEKGNALACSDVTFDADGFPDLASTGVPTLNGEPIFPNVDIYCNIGVMREDLLVVDQLCVKKYMRTWRVFESWCSAGPMVEYFQVIEIQDDENPTIVTPLNINVQAGNGPNCEATVTIPLPEVSDDCVGALTIDISYNGGFLPSVTTAPTVSLPSGVNVIKYRVYDGCQNVDSTTINITVIDSSPPTAVCDQNTVVSLRSDGTAKAWSDTFDDGSFDNCSTIAKTIVRRMDEGCACDHAEFKDMSYLGERNGRYYYLSSKRLFGFQAISFSEAFGGMPLTLESSAEASWVHTQVSAISSDPYYIGLIEKNNTGNYFYTGHVAPVYTNWAMGEPAISGDQAVVDADGSWRSINGGEEKLHYVYEATSACGFGDEISFCCEDAGGDVMVVFRALDKFGGFNECMVSVEVQDKNPPQIVCPNDMTVSCTTPVDTNNLDQFGSATATDACTFDLTDNFIASVNSCGIGQVVRTFTASGANGQSTSTCTQTIGILAPPGSTASSIVWPMDFDTDEGCTAGGVQPDNLPAGFDFPSFAAASCTNLSATFTDQTFSFAGTNADACAKIVRTWSVIDECMHGMPGFAPIRYEQTIKISDNVAPVLSACPDITVTTTNCDTGAVSLSNSATDNCTDDADLNATLSIDEFGNGSIESVINYDGNQINFSADLPLGSHIAISEFFDGCGNKGTCSQTITVQNNVTPLALCQSITIPLQEMDLDGNGTIDTIMAILRAEMLDANNSSLGVSGSSSPCNYDISFSLSATVSDVMTTFDCDDIGTNSVTLFVTDSFGTVGSCNTTVEITDASDRCGGQMINNGMMTGRILNEYTEAVQDVKVDLKGSDLPHVMSSDLGQYAFPEMPLGGNYIIMPTKNDNPLNGVSTLDIIAIQRHILRTKPLDSPYKIIAADIDNSGSITAMDLIELRKIILGVDSEFQYIDSWRMIDAEQVFLDPNNPFASTIREDHTIQGFSKNEVIDFVGVKTGDVNNSAIFNVNDTQVDSRSAESIDLIINASVRNNANQTEITLSLSEVENIEGLQFSLSYDAQQGHIVSVGSDNDLLSNENYHIDRTNKQVHFSWNDNAVKNNNDQLVTIIVSNIRGNKLDFLRIKDSHISSEVYKNGQAYNIRLVDADNVTTQKETTLHQNQPNPWSDNTSISYTLSTDQDIELNFYNPAGQLLYKEIKSAKAGQNISIINNSVFQNDGIIYYELVSDDIRLINKMLLVK